MDVNILIQALQNGELDGNGLRLAPTRTAVQAARALKQLAERIGLDQQTINNLQYQVNLLLGDNQNLRQQLEKRNETKTSNTTTDSTSVDSSEPNNKV